MAPGRAIRQRTDSRSHRYPGEEHNAQGLGTQRPVAGSEPRDAISCSRVIVAASGCVNTRWPAWFRVIDYVEFGRGHPQPSEAGILYQHGPHRSPRAARLVLASPGSLPGVFPLAHGAANPPERMRAAAGGIASEDQHHYRLKSGASGAGLAARRPLTASLALRTMLRPRGIFMNQAMQRSLVAEFLGTFVLVLGGCGTAVLAAGVEPGGVGLLGVSLAFGLTVVVMAYAVGHISGGHFNPAVTLGAIAGGRFPAQDGAPYIVTQVIGAIAAAACCMQSGTASMGLAHQIAALPRMAMTIIHPAATP